VRRRIPVVNVLVVGATTRAIGAGAIGRSAVGALVESGRCAAALGWNLPDRQAIGLDDRAVSPLELELRGNGAAALEDARACADLVCRVVDRLQEAVETVDHPVSYALGGLVSGLVGRRCRVGEAADAVGRAAAQRAAARGRAGEAVVGCA